MVGCGGWVTGQAWGVAGRPDRAARRRDPTARVDEQRGGAAGRRRVAGWWGGAAGRRRTAGWWGGAAGRRVVRVARLREGGAVRWPGGDRGRGAAWAGSRGGVNFRVVGGDCLDRARPGSGCRTAPGAWVVGQHGGGAGEVAPSSDRGWMRPGLAAGWGCSFRGGVKLPGWWAAWGGIASIVRTGASPGGGAGQWVVRVAEWRGGATGRRGRSGSAEALQDGSARPGRVRRRDRMVGGPAAAPVGGQCFGLSDGGEATSRGGARFRLASPQSCRASNCPNGLSSRAQRSTAAGSGPRPIQPASSSNRAVCTAARRRA